MGWAAASPQTLAPGTHMVAHDDVDDEATPRIARWLEEFSDARLTDPDRWWAPWIDVLAVLRIAREHR